MNLLPFKPFILFDEEQPGGEAASEPESQSQEFDPDGASKDDLYNALDNTDWDGEEISPEVTGSESSQETSSKKSTDDDSTEKEAPEPSGEETSSGDSEKLYAGKFKSLEELEAAYQKADQDYRESSKGALEVARERNDLKKKVEEYEKGESPKSDSIPAEDKSDSQAQERDPYELTEAQQQEVDDLRYEKGDTAANARMVKLIEQNKAEVAREQEVAQSAQAEKARQEAAEEYNTQLQVNWAKMQFYDNLRGTEVNEDILDALADPKFEPDEKFVASLKESMGEKAFNALRDQIRTTIEEVESFKADKNGRYSLDHYKKAHLIVNHEKIKKDIARHASEQTVQQIKKGAPVAKVASPTGTSHVGVKPRLNSNMTPEEAQKATRGQSLETLYQLLDEEAAKE